MQKLTKPHKITTAVVYALYLVTIVLFLGKTIIANYFDKNPSGILQIVIVAGVIPITATIIEWILIKSNKVLWLVALLGFIKTAIVFFVTSVALLLILGLSRGTTLESDVYLLVAVIVVNVLVFAIDFSISIVLMKEKRKETANSAEIETSSEDVEGISEK